LEARLEIVPDMHPRNSLSEMAFFMEVDVEVDVDN
jgi:hypothetical protein